MTDTNDQYRQSPTDDGATDSQRVDNPEVQAQVAACRAILNLIPVDEFRAAFVIHKDLAQQISDGTMTSVSALRKSIKRRLYSLREPDQAPQGDPEPSPKRPDPARISKRKQEEEPWD